MPTKKKHKWESINVFMRCKQLNVGLWSCPQFIFLVMGMVIILSILTTYSIAEHYAEPEVVIGLVVFLTIFLLIITKIIVGAFEKVVYSRQRELAHAEEIIELKDQFVHIAIHDIASSATAIKWGMRMMEPELGGLSPENKELFEEMKGRNEKLIHLTGEILLITRIESGRVELSLSEINIGAIMTEIVEDLRESKEVGQVILEWKAPEIPLIITSDQANLGEVLKLLLHNVVSHIDRERGGTITIELLGSADAIMVMVGSRSVRTTEDRLHLFEKFWKDSSGKNIAGKGFGLYIVKQLLLFLGGNISFAQVEGKDMFTISLPITPLIRK